MVPAAIRRSKSAARSLVLPRPLPARPLRKTAGPLIVAGMFRTGNGLGRAARSCFEALDRLGFDPVAADLSGHFDQADLDPAIALSERVEGDKGTLIVFVNPPELEQALFRLGLRRGQKWRIIGAWAWELPCAPPSWVRQARFVSEIWAPSRFVAAAFAHRYDKPVRIVPHHVSLPAEAAASAPPGSDAPLRILTLADARSSLERKNPAAAVRMFQAAFPPGMRTELLIKCRNLHLFAREAGELRRAAGQDPRIRILDVTLSDEAQRGLIRQSDIILSPHRSEGFGIHMAEAMSEGRCVIATGWSGNLDFMDETCARLLPFSLRPVTDQTGIYSPAGDACWAEPDFEAGVSALRELAADPALRERMGEAGRRMIEARLGPHGYSNALLTPPSSAGMAGD